MATDWIKMRSDLYRDPKVCVMADFLLDRESHLAMFVSQILQSDMSITRNVMRNATVGALVAVWGVTRHRGKRFGNDLVLNNSSHSVVDDIADMPGFGDAMLLVGWIKEKDNAIVFPNFFDEFNVDPDDDGKKKNAERQRRYREKIRNESRDVTVASQSNAREEKRREENIKPKPIARSDLFGNGQDPTPIVENIPLNDGTEFAVHQSLVTELDRLYPGVDPVQTLKEIRGWCIGNPTKRKTIRGVNRFITGWFAREQDRG